MRNGYPTAEIILTDVQEVVKGKLQNWSIEDESKKRDIRSQRQRRFGGEEGGVEMTLTQMAKSYRDTADVFRHRIQLVEELPARTEAEAIAKAERLRLLEAMRRDVRDIAVICERYYDKSYHRSGRYCI